MADLTSRDTALYLVLVDIAITRLVDCGSSACCKCDASARVQMPGTDKRQASLGVQFQVLLLTTQYQHQRLISNFVHRQ